MTRSIVLTVPKASPSLNATTRQHWRVYYRQKKLWEKLLWVAKAEAGIYGMPMFEYANVRICRYGAKLLDPDNLVGGMKPLIDSLKALGIIVDDSPAHMSLSVMQGTDTNHRTVIQVAVPAWTGWA